jgi:hypothetical protein
MTPQEMIPMHGRRIIVFTLLALSMLSLSLACQRIGLPGRQRTAAAEPGTAPRGLIFDGMAATGGLPHDTTYTHYARNPIIPGENIYAPSPVKDGDTWFVFYGGWSTRERYGRDDVYLATTDDPHLRGPYEEHDIVVHRGVYVHVNDPSVVRLDDLWVMALTVYDERDWVAIITSEDGIRWSPGEFEDSSHEVRIRGAEFATIARPSLNYNPDRRRWEMYFDGRIEGGQAGQFLAVAQGADVPSEFELVERIGGWADADIRRLPDGRYIAAYRNLNEPSPWSIRFAMSEDGVDFQPFGIFLQNDPVNPYDDAAVSNPGWAIEPDGTVVAVLFGGSEHGLTYHQIGIAYPQLIAQPITDVPHNFRQALSRDAQLVMVPADTAVHRFVLWRNMNCPTARYEFPLPHFRGDRTRVRMPRSGCLPLDHFASPLDQTEDPFDYRPEDPTAGYTVTASSSHSEGLGPENVLTRGGMWSSEGHETPEALEWIQIELPQEMRITGVTLTPRGGGYGFPRGFEFQYSLDGESWLAVPAHSFWDYPNPGGTRQQFRFQRPLVMRYFRIVADELSSDQFDFYYFQLGRIELHRP